MSIESNLSPRWIESQYLRWKESPQSLSPEWQAYFQGFELGAKAPPEAQKGLSPEGAMKQSAVQSLIYRYRDIGHLLACTDPLSPCPTEHPLLDLEAFGLGTEDLDRTFHTRRFLRKSAPLRDIVETLRETYCRSIGAEFMHIQNPLERQWLIDRMEPKRNHPDLTREEKLRILGKLLEATTFENYLHRKFPAQKRFSLEGAEVLIPMLDDLALRASAAGVKDLVLGMAHRGRLNVLANIFGKPLENIFAEFDDNLEFGFVGEGDVKYHKGFSTDLNLDGEKIHVTLASNPSHLEAVDPVVEGKCRARQDWYGTDGPARVLPVLIHGDAAFAGQGMVAETLNLSQLEGYRTGGTLHIVLNNQIGFTTVPADARSTRYATDIAKMLMVPIFHVHGENPEAVVHTVRLAFEYRQSFGRDVVVEVICYRRHGHNEGDEPYFTQPLMYEKIKDRPPVSRLYADRLLEEGLEEDVPGKMSDQAEKRLEMASDRKPELADIVGFKGKWSEIQRHYEPLRIDTGVPWKTLRRLGGVLTTIPEDFRPHPKIEKFLQRRSDMIEDGKGIDWSTAESLAFASLLQEGIAVRLSGQDSRRGTFSQRHSVLFDIENGRTWIPLSEAAGEKSSFQVYDSMLSEAAVLGFEYGYAIESPYALTIWEAQFGDFVNGAQVIIDQFIVSSETKWDRVSGITLFLPHGYEGQGPEHSSARFERFLQLSANNNIQVTYPSTPAQFFHLLRRQVLQPFRRPLVVLTPKSLLRHPQCVSSLDELAEGGFREVLPAGGNPERAENVLLCSGKIFYELLERKEKEERKDTAIIRIEQLYPFHGDLLKKALEPHRHAQRVVWVQEEPRNAGAWEFLRPRLTGLLGREPDYAGRDEAASPAVGSHRLHKEEQEKILEEAFRG